MGKPIKNVECHYLKLFRTKQNVETIYDKHMKPSGISLGQSFLLTEILKNQGCTMNRLSEITCLDRSSISRALKPLMVANLVVDDNDPGKRDSVLMLTEEGRKAQQRAISCWKQAQKEYEEMLGEEKVREFESIMEAFENV